MSFKKKSDWLLIKKRNSRKSRKKNVYNYFPTQIRVQTDNIYQVFLYWENSSIFIADHIMPRSSKREKCEFEITCWIICFKAI